MDFEYSSNCGPRMRKFDNNNAILSGLHWPMDTESATFSTNVISSSTVINKNMSFKGKKKRKKNQKCSSIFTQNDCYILNEYILVCNSYAGVVWCVCRLALFDFNGRGASKFFDERLTCDIFCFLTQQNCLYKIKQWASISC